MVRAVRFSKDRCPLQKNTCRFLARVTTAAGIHLFPFRTEKLSPPAPMVLRGRLRGRVGRRPSFCSFEVWARLCGSRSANSTYASVHVGPADGEFEDRGGVTAWLPRREPARGEMVR